MLGGRAARCKRVASASGFDSPHPHHHPGYTRIMDVDIKRTENPRKQGDAGVGVAIAYYALQGYTVSVPLADSQRYDLIVDDGELKRVQVKTTTRTRNGNYLVQLLTKGGNKSGHTVKHFDPSECEVLFVVTGEGSVWEIPTSVVGGRSEISLFSGYDEYRVG